MHKFAFGYHLITETEYCGFAIVFDSRYWMSIWEDSCDRILIRHLAQFLDIYLYETWLSKIDYLPFLSFILLT